MKILIIAFIICLSSNVFAGQRWSPFSGYAPYHPITQGVPRQYTQYGPTQIGSSYYRYYGSRVDYGQKSQPAPRSR